MLRNMTNLTLLEQTTTNDPETGWTVLREKRAHNESGHVTYYAAITDPVSGETYERSGDKPLDSVRVWLEEIKKNEANAARRRKEARERLEKLYPELAQGAPCPNGPLGMIKLRFAEVFTFPLPEADVVARRRGKIEKNGWMIWYLFDSDDRGEYLDYRACHRMTNDRHVRIHADGDSTWLEDAPEHLAVSKDPVENARLEAAYRAEHTKLQKILRKKGFDDSPPKPWWRFWEE